jgi:sigma-B regulation protein RsbU (phosphoserine phosphatase)
MVRERDPDLPVIVVTGNLGDEAAASVIKSGANDYVLKDRLARLAPAVERAVEEAQQSRARRRAEREIRTLNVELEQRVLARTVELQNANRVKDELIESERATCLELERLRSRDIEVGLRIQQSLLLSQPPEVPGLEIAALTVPSEGIDGDFYIFVAHPNQSLDVIVGDVMGKGIPAALLGAATKSEFLTALSYLLAVARDGSFPAPKDVVMLAHTEIVRHLIDLESYVTVCYARLDLVRRILSIVDCGHTGLLHWHAATGRCGILHGDCLPMGIREGEVFDEISTAFEPHDVLLFFSDGITEARNSAGELFGGERLVRHVEENSRLDPALLADSIRQAVSDFSGSTHLGDDLTSVVIRIGQPPMTQARAEMEIRSNLRNLREVRHFVREFCNSLEDPVPDEDVVDALELAASEVASNIMLHAYHGRTDQPIHLEAEARPGAVTVMLRHMGAGFESAGLEPPLPDGKRESGFGTYMIFRSVDQARYYRDERSRSCVSLVKNRRN